MVTHAAIMSLLYTLRGAHGPARHYPEIATAFERAANTDPVIPGEHGPELTVCLLIADAWDSSRLEPYAMRGRRLGLFMIRPPISPKLPPGALTTPRTAALVAVDLMRTSVAHCARLP